MELSIVQRDGKKSDTGMTVSEAAFGSKFNQPLIHQVVIAYQAGARLGTRAQKNRSAVRGGGSKPWRQKGTGRARAGTNRSPLWRGGGRVFPAQTHDFSQKVNRKMYRAAMRSIFSELARQDRLWVCDELSMDAPKTKQLADALKALGTQDVLIVQESVDDNLSLSARNLHGVDVRTINELDPVSLIAHEQVLITPGAVKQVEEWLQ